MDDDTAREFERVTAETIAGLAIHRQFLSALLYRLILDVPGFSHELLSEQLHLLHANEPHSGEPQLREFERAGAEELRRVIEMAERAIAEALQTKGKT